MGSRPVLILLTQGGGGWLKNLRKPANVILERLLMLLKGAIKPQTFSYFIGFCASYLPMSKPLIETLIIRGKQSVDYLFKVDDIIAM